MAIQVPILIVGGGMSGLSTALQLAHHGVQALVVEKHSSTAHLPKAHTLNQRSMEIYRHAGIMPELRKEATPSQHIQKAAWRTSFGGDLPSDGKVVVSVDSFGGGNLQEQYLSASPEPYASLHQVRFEPFLASMVAQQPLIDLRFDTAIDEFYDDGDGVRAIIRNLATGETEEVHAQYAVGADGGRFFQSRLGYEMEGITGLGDNITLWFKADLSRWMDDDTLLNWFITPDSFGMAAGVLVPVGLGKTSKEWVLHFGYPAGQGASVTDEQAVQRMKDLFKLPDLEFEIIKVSRWFNESVVANRFRTGRVISLGDAIHRHVPTLGIGMNSAIGDSNNLAWKLAYVVQGHAPDSLLDTFETDRRPILERNAELSLLTYYLHMGIGPQIGMVPGAPVEYNEKVLDRYFEDSPAGRERRERTANLVWGDQRLEHQALDLELGYRYWGPGIVADKPIAFTRDPMLNAYQAAAVPGARLPHAWLTSPDGTRISTLDLVDTDFTLIVPSIDSPWKAAVEKIDDEGNGFPISVAVIGEGGFSDSTGRWSEIVDLGTNGALLMRPDQHISWVAMTLPSDPAAVLRHVFAEATTAQSVSV